MHFACGGIPPYMSDQLAQYYATQQSAFYQDDDHLERQRKAMERVDAFRSRIRPHILLKQLWLSIFLIQDNYW
jgi:hypothetical protein